MLQLSSTPTPTPTHLFSLSFIPPYLFIWFRYEFHGGLGVCAIALLGFGVTILAVTFAIHCTDLLDRWAGPGTLDWVMVTPAVQAVVACCCLVLFMNSIYVLGQFTCCCKFCMVTPPPLLHTNPPHQPLPPAK